MSTLSTGKYMIYGDKIELIRVVSNGIASLYDNAGGVGLNYDLKLIPQYDYPIQDWITAITLNAIMKIVTKCKCEMIWGCIVVV